MARVGRLIVFAIVTVALILTAAGGIAWVLRSRSTYPPQPLQARHADLYGRAQLARDQSFSWDHRLPGTIGPMTVSLAGTTVSVPEGTPVYGAACGDFDSLEGTDQPPCFLQIGLTDDPHVAAWVAGFYVPPEPTQFDSLPRVSNIVQSITPAEIVLFDGVTIPTSSATALDCRDRPTLSNLPGAMVQVDVDPTDGHAVKIGCLYRA